MSTDLNLRLAQAIEWDMNVRDWEHSFDACLRDIVPVLRARGWELSMWTNYRTGLWGVAFLSTKFPGHNPKAEDVSLPAAFCSAALRALEATENPGD